MRRAMRAVSRRWIGGKVVRCALFALTAEAEACRLCNAKYNFTTQSIRDARPCAPAPLTGGLAGPRESATLQVKEAPSAAVVALGRRRCIEQHPFEHRQIAEKALAPVGRDAA